MRLWDSVLAQGLPTPGSFSPSLLQHLHVGKPRTQPQRVYVWRTTVERTCVTITQGLCWNLSIAWRKYHHFSKYHKVLLIFSPIHCLQVLWLLSLFPSKSSPPTPCKIPSVLCLWPILAPSFPSYFFLIDHHWAWQQADKASLEQRRRKRLNKVKQIVSGRQGWGEGEDSCPSVVFSHQKEKLPVGRVLVPAAADVKRTWSCGPAGGLESGIQLPHLEYQR